MVKLSTIGTLLSNLMRVSLSAALVGVILSSCSNRDDIRYPYGKGRVVAEEPVPFVRLIARPEVYHGQQIAVSGYLHVGFEENALYYHNGDYVHDLYKNGIWLALPTAIDEHKRLFDDIYVTVIGTFDAKSYGHGRLFAGSLRDIVAIDVIAQSDGTVPTNPPYLKLDGSSVTIGRIE